jgi:hypothetical protein
MAVLIKEFFEIVEQVIRYNLVWVSLRLINREAVYEKRKLTKVGYASITCSIISNIPYNLIFTTKFNNSSILITIISCDYLNLSLADEHVGDVTIPTHHNVGTVLISNSLKEAQSLHM